MTDKMWVERHRPESLDDVAGHPEVISRLEDYADDDRVPHMIFAGPPGVGKTAAITAFAREVFGDNWRANLEELNASDERGIDTIRDKVKGIARSNPAGDAPFKIIFLDEADQLSSDAQPALRRIMEDYSDVTRFFLSCNYLNKIIDPLQSRCSTFRFGPLEDDELRGVLQNVAESEGLQYQDIALDQLVRSSRGDARSAINSLQSAAVDGEITEASVSTVVGTVDDREVGEIVDLAIEGSIDEAMMRLDTNLLKEGADSQMICDSFLRVLKRKDMPEPGKVKCLDKLAECEWRVMNGANKNVQFHSLIADIRVGYHMDYGSYEGGE